MKLHRPIVRHKAIATIVEQWVREVECHKHPMDPHPGVPFVRPLPPRNQVLKLTLLISIVLAEIILCSGAAAEPIRITSAIQLFVDDHLVDTTAGLRRNVHHWQKHADNPVLRPDQPWEYGGNYLNAYGSVIYDTSEQIFKAWYWTMNAEDSKVPTHNIKMMCYATSSDGIHWEKPSVNIHRFQGSTENNIVLVSRFEDLNSIPTLFTFGAIRTPSDPDPAKLYKACFYERPPGAKYISPHDGAWAGVSPDGIHWTKSEAPIMPQVGDTVGLLYDSIHERYVCFGKRYVDRDRTRFQCESNDFVRWTKPHLILRSDAQDDQPCDFYNNTGFVWGEMLLGWLQVFYKHDDPYKHRLVLELVHSRDGLNWNRMPGREPVLEVGADGSWDRTNQSPANGAPIVVQDRMYMYYGGDIRYHGPRKGVDLGVTRGQIGLGTLRRDGFVSMDATPGDGGVLTTKPLLLSSERADDATVRLLLNVKSDNGHCRVELLDESGGAIAGWGKEEADDSVVDAVRTVVTWNGQSDIGKLLHQPIRLRFHLQNARLYGFQFSSPQE